MKIVQYKGLSHLRVQAENGDHFHINVDYLTKVEGWKDFSQQAINYCTGKKPITIKSWWSRLNSVLRPTIIDSEMKAFPKDVEGWSTLVKNIYLTVLTTTAIESSIYTRVAIWNKNVHPFLEYLKERDRIPIEVVVPLMKQVDQKQKNSSFRVTLVGDKAPYKVDHSTHLEKLISPVSLSRTDSEYLDELYYDLERKRNALHRALTAYWNNLKAHFDAGLALLDEIDNEEIQRRLNVNDFYDSFPRKNAPPLRRHFTSGYTKQSFASYLFLSRQEKGYVRFSSTNENSGLAGRSTMYSNASTWRRFFPVTQLEVDRFGESVKMNWMLGLLGNIDISFIVALLMMENPKFTYLSLLNCKVEDKDGKSRLEVGETSVTFTIEKNRAKALKKENLSSLSVEIISTLLDMRTRNFSNIPPELAKYLFVIYAQNTPNKIFNSPQQTRVTMFLTGREHQSTYIGTYFPSLESAGISRNLLTHSKLRATEGVLEYFRTGSISAVSRKLGNGNRVVLEHYLPKPLLAAYNTRQVRRFQNLLLVSACAGEDYLLDAVDFNNLNELHTFIVSMLSLDTKGRNPLINYLKERLGDTKGTCQGDLVANISEQSLSVLYAYNIVAETQNVSASYLAQKDSTTGMAPIAFITLAKHLNLALSQHTEKSVRKANQIANEKALEMAPSLDWGGLMVTRTQLS